MITALYAVAVAYFGVYWLELGRYTEALPKWLHKPLFGCFQCTSGQIALWSALISGSSLFETVGIAALSVLFADVIDRKL